MKTFDTVFTRYRTKFIYFAYTYLQDQAAAEDIVMDSFIYYWENKDSLEQDSNIPAYILKVIKNKCIDHLRHQIVHAKATDYIRSMQERTNQVNLISLEACDPLELFHEDTERIVKKALASLPDMTQRIFFKSRFENLSYKEIAIQLNISEKTVEFHISKALKSLRIALKDYLPGVLAWLLLSN